MPIYEFYCPDNHTIYAFFAKATRYAGVVPKCPADPAFRMVRLLSSFAVSRKRSEAPKTGPSSGADDADDTRLDAAMAQMEQEFGSMDPENPDPRAMGRMMRRMAELSGEKVDPGMEEVFRRLEEGADPESLEQEYGDLLGGEEPATEPGDPATGAESKAAPKTAGAAAPRLRVRPPRRDPELHEFEPLPYAPNP